MAGNEQIQRKQRESAIIQSERDMKLQREDQRAIERFSQPQHGVFKASSGRSTARNYRDYALYRAMRPQEAQPYGRHQGAAEYITRRCAFLDTMQDERRLDLANPDGREIQAEQQLRTEDALLHLCGSKLLEKELDEGTLRELADHLTAGQMWREGKNPNADWQEEMQQSGLKALQEIYFRHLEAMDKKYGESLIKMTPSQYLKAMPDIEADFAVVEDMRRFFAAYQPLEAADTDQQLMGKKLDFYAGAWEALKEQERVLVTLDPDALTEKGELTKQSKNAHQKQMRDLRDTAKQNKAFSKRRKKPKSVASFFAGTQSVKSQALTALTNRQAFEKSDEEDEKLANMVARSFPEELTTENVLNLLEEVTKQIGETGEFLQTASDSQLLKQYDQALKNWDFVQKRISVLRFNGLLNKINLAIWDHEAGTKKLSDDVLQHYRAISEATKTCTETERGYLSAPRMAKKRMQDIAKYGCTQGRDLLETEDVLGRSEIVGEQLKLHGKQGPISFDEAKRIQILSGVFDLRASDSTIAKNIAQSRTHIAAIRKISEIKKNQPDYYRLGQSYQDYRHCEKLLELLDVYEKALSLFLRIHHLNEMGEVDKSDQAMLDELEEAFKTESERFFAMVNNINGSGLSPEELKRAPANDLRSAQKLADQKESYAREHLMDEDISGELLQEAKEAGGLAFLELPAEGEQEVPAAATATMKEDLKAVKSVALYTMGLPPTEEQQRGVARLLERFARQYSQIVETLAQQNNFSDWSLAEHRTQLEQCAMMGGFLWKTISDNFMEGYLKEPELSKHFTDQDRERLAELEKQHTSIRSLANYATGLVLGQAGAGKVKDVAIPRLENAGGTTTLDSAEKVREEAVRRRQLGEKGVNSLRVNYAKEAHQAQLELNDQIGKAVGRERQASARKGTESVGGIEWAMQGMSWMLRDQRTKDHGESQYRACRQKYLEYQQIVGRQSVLSSWQRGDAGYAPPVELKKYYESPMKHEIMGLMGPKHFAEADFRDFWDVEFMQAIEAIQSYCGVEGIVNSDTTEMEMAFLDTFKKRMDEYMEGSEGIESEVIRSRRQLLKDISVKLQDNLTGTLAQTISAEELKAIDARTVAYIEDTTFGENLEESNIKDIPLFLHEPNINDVRQSSIGDCWLLSAVSAVVKTSPDFIRSMFHDLGDGNVLVRLYDNAGCPQYFKVRKHYETGWGNANDCIWTQLLEKAYALAGFNGTTAMEVRGDRLYNVAAELTDGDPEEGILHLTGRLPDTMDLKSEPGPLDAVLCEGMVAGMEPKLADNLKAELRYCSRNLEQKLNGEPFTYDKVLTWLKEDWWFFDTQGLIEKTGKDKATSEEQEAFFNKIWTIIQENLGAMRRGEALNVPEEQRKDEEKVRTFRKQKLEYLGKEQTYPQKTMDFILRCNACVQNGGAVSIVLGGHCLDVIDVKEQNGKWFLLVRDPFNIYNTVYQKGGKQGESVESSSEGFGHVFLSHKKNRKLSDNRKDVIHGGFRGTSWWEADDVFKDLGGAHFLTAKDFHN